MGRKHSGHSRSGKNRSAKQSSRELKRTSSSNSNVGELQDKADVENEKAAFSRSPGYIKQQNINHGLAAEKRVQKLLGKKALFISPKDTFDGGKPDFKYEDRFVEVKSIREWVDDGDNTSHGRSQFLKSELENLRTTNGFVIIEIRHSDQQFRESGKYDYYQATAQEIYELVKGEQGEELKVEYSQITQLKGFHGQVEV